jgi:hypothetical protein
MIAIDTISIHNRGELCAGNLVYVGVMYNPTLKRLAIHHESTDLKGAVDLIRLAANEMEAKNVIPE